MNNKMVKSPGLIQKNSITDHEGIFGITLTINLQKLM